MIAVPEWIFYALTRALNRCSLSLLPRHKRCWGEALVGEQQEIESPRERLIWAAGGAYMTAIEVFKNTFADRWTWFLGSLLGIISAAIDLHSASRLPHIIFLFCSAFVLTLWQPKWPWRWAAIVALCLPIVVLALRDWGPYAVDQFDMFYGIVPAAAGTMCGLVIRRISDRLNKKALTH